MTSRSPQWEQNANRDTKIVDPVVTIQELSRFTPLQTARIDYALVFTTARGEFHCFLPPHRPSRMEVATRRWTSVYAVDVGLHEAESTLTLPSRDDAFRFDVTMNIRWRVADPAIFVASGERDVPALMRRFVDDSVRPVLRTYAIEDSTIAEKDAQEALVAAGPLGVAAGLRVRCEIQVSRDEAALEHARRLREIEFARQRLDPQHTLSLREDRLTAERALAQGRHRHQLEVQDRRLGHERELMRGAQEVELQDIEAKKIRYYAYYLEQDGPIALAFRLARHPEDARLVMENLRSDQLRLLQAKLQIALQALDGGPGGLEEHQLAEPRRIAATVIEEILRVELPCVTDEGEFALPGARREGTTGGRAERDIEDGKAPDGPTRARYVAAVPPDAEAIFGRSSPTPPRP
ncbi:SPFH domain-containing protein [Embleya sp. NPDC059237]|uniref:SPFH domain-containing protein n=1 Tax=Embleya sp. NPDC059237 TaxID=3346784 RepID=UPI0036B2FEE1